MKILQITEGFEWIAAREGARPALSSATVSLNYSELLGRVHGLAAQLHGLSRRPGSFVFLLASDIGDLAPAILACLRQGLVFVPLDPSFPEARLRGLVALDPEGLLLAAQDYLELAQGLASAHRVLPLDHASAQFERPPIHGLALLAEAPAYVYFTSGSSGQPKPILGRLGSLSHYFRVLPPLLRLPERPRIAQLAAPSFDAFLRELFLALLSGGCLVQPQNRSLLGDGRALGAWLSRECIDLISCVPTLFRTLAHSSQDKLPARVLLAGEALTVDDWSRWYALRPEHGLLFNLYGPTETTLTRLIQVLPCEVAPTAISLGQPLEGVCTWIAGRDGLPLAKGRSGEIMLQTEFASHGYFNQPRLTAEAFVPSPLAGCFGARAYRSGDLGHCNDGFWISGRLDRQVKHQGVRLHLEEVEGHLRAFAGIADVAVVVQHGAQGQRLLAFLTGTRDDGVRLFLAERLPAAMIPNAFIWLEHLPLLANGKLDRNALQQWRNEVVAVAPRNDLETLVLEQFNQVLKGACVDVHGDFFQLGGHSLLALNLLSRLQQVSGKSLTLHAFFRGPNPAAVAKLLAQHDNDAITLLNTSSQGQRFAQSSAQRRIYFIHEMEGASTTYNLNKTWLLSCALDAAAFEQAWTLLVEHQWSLRTRFGQEEHQLVQTVEEMVPFRLQTLDLNALDDDRREQALEQVLRACAQQPFRLQHPPLYRWLAIRIDGERWVLSLVIHHIAADAWSLRYLESRLFNIYLSLVRGQQPQAPEPGVQMVALCAEQREAPDFEQLLASRVAQLRRIALGQPLAYSGALPQTDAAHAAFAFAHMDLEVVDAVIDLARRLGITPFSLYLSVFAATLARSSRRNSLVLAVPWFNRERPETHQLIGMLVDTLVVPLEFFRDDSADNLLLRHRANLIEALHAAQIPFETLVARLNPRRTRSNPLTAVSFNYLDLPKAGPPGELPLTPWSGPRASRVRFELSLVVRTRVDGLQLELRYGRELFASHCMETLLDDFCAELQRFLAEPQALLQFDGDGGFASTNEAGNFNIPSHVYREPNDPITVRLAQLWSPLLKVDRVGCDDDFFALGGHSMSALRLLAEIENSFSVRLSLRQVFISPSLEAMADAIRHAGTVEPEIEVLPEDRLSSGQRRLWSLARLHGNVAAYHLGLGFQLNLPLKPALLLGTYRRLLQRHGELCAYFPAIEGEPRRRFIAVNDMPLYVCDASGLGDCQRKNLSQRIRQQTMSQPFLLAKGPLVRVTVLVEPDNHFSVFVVFHHMIGDAFSKRIIRSEFATIYAALVAGKSVQLPDAGPGYAAFARRQGIGRAESLAFFREHLEGASADLGLINDGLDADHPSFLGGRLVFALSGKTARALDALARQCHATPFQLSLALFALFLQRYCDREDLCIGLPVTQRSGSAWRHTIGFFANTIVLRFRAGNARHVVDWIERVRHLLIAAMEHVDLPFEDLVSALGSSGGERTPLFQVMFNFREGESLQVGSRHASMDQKAAKFDLLLNIVHRPGRYRGSLIYSSDHFKASSAQRLLDHFCTLLNQVCAHTAAPLWSLPLMSVTERKRLLLQSQSSDPESPYLTLHQWFESQARCTPWATAVIGRTVRLSYAELDEAASRAAWRLRQYGLGCEQTVVLSLGNEPLRLVCLLAVLKAGAAFAPLDLDLPDAARKQFLQALKPSAIIGDFGMDLVSDSGKFLQVKASALVAPGDAVGIQPEIPPDAAAYILFTSGSTGNGKGVIVPHRQSVSLFAWSRSVFSEDECRYVLASTQLSFDVALFELFVALSRGGTLVLAENLGAVPPSLAAQISLVCASPSAARMICAWPEKEGRKLTVNLAGESPTSELLERLSARCDVNRILNIYGPTEFSIYATCNAQVVAQLPALIGRAIAGRAAYVLDQRLEPCPDLVIGSLFLGGEGAARGYLFRPDETALRFIPDPFSNRPGQRLYHTGDLVARQCDGGLHYYGRRDRQHKLRGIRIELAEIETVLNECDQVETAFVDVRNAQHQGTLIAWILPALNCEANPLAACRAWAAARLAQAKIPQQWFLLDEVPMLPSGKVNRKALPVNVAQADAYQAPENDVERLLAELWCALLKLERVGRHDSFFSLGGDSISAILLAAAARTKGVSLHPREILLAPTIAQLAQHVVAIAPLELDQAALTGEVALAPIQHWYFELDPEVTGFFTQHRAIEPQLSLDLRVLRQALQTLCDHHDMLRARFHVQAGQWIQTVAPAPGTFLLSEVHPGADETQFHDQVREQVAQHQRRMGPKLGHMFAALLFRRPQGRDLLVLVAHHLIIDGISWRILIDDLSELYEHCAWGEAPQLPAKTHSYRDWVQSLLQFAEQEPSQAERDWLARIRSARFPLPTLSGSQDPRLRGEETFVRLKLERRLTRLLDGPILAKRRVNAETLLLSGLVAALSRWTASRQVLVFMEKHGRDHLGLDVSRTLGWFTRLFPVVFEAELDATCAQILRLTKEALHQVPEGGRAYGMNRYLRGDGTLNPAPGVLFNYMGSLDRSERNSGRWRRVAMPLRSRGDSVPRGFLLEINAHYVEDRLQLRVSYPDGAFAKDQIEALIQIWVDSLDKLTQLIQSQASAAFTPCDFPQARLNQVELDELCHSWPSSRLDQLEDLRRLTPFQEGMLYHGLQGGHGGEYVLQRAYRLEKNPDVSLWKMAWSRLIARHDALRTAFIWEHLYQPHQWVARQFKPEWLEMDWRHLNTSQQAAHWSHLLIEQRGATFLHDQDPPLRLCLVRIDEEHWYHVLTIQHILVDGWSLALMQREVQRMYRALIAGIEPVLPAAPSFAQCLAARQQDPSAIDRFWKDELAHASLLRIKPGLSGARFSVEQRLDPEVGARLITMASARGLTLYPVLQGAWALTLAQLSGCDDVLFGITLSGRAQLFPGVERLVGPCCQTVPARLRIERELPLALWLEGYAERQIERELCADIALGSLHQQLGLPAGQRLFDSLLVYENFPRLRSKASSRAKLVHSHDRADYPMTLLIHGKQNLRLRLVIEHGAISAVVANACLGRFCEILARMPLNLFQPIGELFEGLSVMDPCFETRSIRSLKSAPSILRPPKTPMQQRLAGIWSDVLGVAVEDIDHSFFELGGNSLLLIRLFGLLQQDYGSALTFADLFARPSIALLAELLDRSDPMTAAAQLGRERADLRRNLRRRQMAKPQSTS